MQLVADAVLIVARRRDDEEQRLLTGIAGAFRQYIVELAVRLGMDFIEHQPRHVQAVLGAGLGGQHLIEACVAVVDDALARRSDLERRMSAGLISTICRATSKTMDA